MPSLQALEQFKNSFRELGGEIQTLDELNLPVDDLLLPDHEPDLLPVESDDLDLAADIDDLDLSGDIDLSDNTDDGFMDLNDLGDLIAATQFEENGFGDNLNGDSTESVEDTDLPDFGEDTVLPDLDDIGSADDLPDFADTDLAGLDTTEPDDLGNMDDSSFADDLPDFDDSNLDDLSFDDNSGLDGITEDINLDDGSLDDDSSESGDLGDLDDLFASLENDVTSEQVESTDLPSEDMELDDLGNDDLGNMDDSSFADDLPDFDDNSLDVDGLGDSLDDLSFDDDSSSADDSLDDLSFDDDNTDNSGFADDSLDNVSFDIDDSEDSSESGDLDELFASLESGITSEQNDVSTDMDISDSTEDNDLEDFFPEGSDPEENSNDSFDNYDLDSIIPSDDDKKDDGETDLPDMQDFFDEASRARAKAPDNSQNIELSQEEMVKFLENLASYPLNLRIACKEIIAEQEVAPEQLFKLIKLIISNAKPAEAADLAGRIQGRVINIPRNYEQMTGEALEIEQGSFAYIFVHNFLPVFRLFMGVILVVLSIAYLYWHFIHTPMRAERIYRLGLEQIEAGRYARANERFLEAYNIRQREPWFYTYARAFRAARQYNLAEEKYQQLLHFTASRNRRNIPRKEAVLEYADMLTNDMGNFEAADSLIRRNILDYTPMDREGLLALGDNAMAWGEYDPTKYEDAREAYARIMEQYGQSDPMMERMLLYFIRTDNLGYVISLQSYFMESNRTVISSETLSEMGGYLLDKRMETVRGVPNEYLNSISGIREALMRALRQNPLLPEAYYHLARYYNYYNDYNDEVATLELAVRVFEIADEANARRIRYHINTLGRYADILIDRREFFAAEEYLIRAVRLFENALSRRLFTNSPEFGKLYAALGDLEYFVKEGDMVSALRYYRQAEINGWNPPELLYRMGAAHYQLREWGTAQDYLMAAHRGMDQNRRILYALGNVSYMRGNYFAAQAYYNRLVEILEADRSRLPPIQPTDNIIQLDLAERLMVAQNNLGVTLEALTDQTGNNQYRFAAQGLYSDSQRAWDIITRNPETMIRMRPSPDLNAPGVSPPFLNIQNSLRPIPGFQHHFFLRIDMDMLEPSDWEELAPPGYMLSQGIHTGR